MVQEIMHVGMTVLDVDRSIAFYRDVLGMTFKGELMMEGAAADRLFRRKNCKVRVAYLNGSEDVMAPPIELIQFLSDEEEKAAADLLRTSISEICFRVKDIDAAYQQLLDHGVECLSAPQEFDYTEFGFGKSRALYFKDPDGIIQELMQAL